MTEDTISICPYVTACSRSTALLLVVGLSSIHPTPLDAQGKDYFLIRKRDLICVLDNVELYRRQPTDPVLIAPSECPETDTRKILSKLSRNSSPVFPYIQAPAEIDFALTLNKSEFDCFTRLRETIEGDPSDIIRVPIKPCPQ